MEPGSQTFTLIATGVNSKGGVIRDALAGDVPLSFSKGSNYASSAFFGSVSFYFLMFINTYLAISISILITLFLREIVSPFGIYKKIFKRKK